MRHYPHEVVKLPFDRCKIVEDVGMVELQVIQNRGLWTVLHEFGALIEEGGVVLVRLYNEKIAAGVSGGHREIDRNPANEEARRLARALQDPGEHRRDGRLAVSAGDGQHMASGEHVIGEPLRS